MHFRSLTAIVLSFTVALSGFAGELHILLFHSGSISYVHAGYTDAYPELPPAGISHRGSGTTPSKSMVFHEPQGQPFFHPACPLNTNGSSFRLYFQEKTPGILAWFQMERRTDSPSRTAGLTLILAARPRAPPAV